MRFIQKLSKAYLAAMLPVLAGAALAACADDDDEPGLLPATGGSGGAAGSDAGGDDAAAGAGGMAGTGGTGGSAGEGGAGPGTQAMLRVVHASPTAPAVDIYANGNDAALMTGLAYGSATPYLELPAGTYDLSIRAAGSASTDPAAFQVTGLQLTGGATYTAIAVGDLASSDEADKFRVLPLQEGFEAPAAGTVRVRVVHAGLDAPAVDLDVGNDDPANAEVKNVARFADTGPTGIELPAEQAVQLGIVAGSSTVTAFTSPPLPAGLSALVIATGELGLAPRDRTGFALLGVLPDSTTAWVEQNPFVYALHASPDAPAVDIYAGESELYDQVAFGELGRAQVPPGSHTLDFFAGQEGATPRPSSAPAASAATPALEAGETYLAVAAGMLAETGANGFQLIPLSERFGPAESGTARVRALHASPDAPAVDIGAVVQGRLAENPPIKSLAFGASTDAAGLALPAGELTVGLAPAGSLDTVKQFAVTIPDSGRLFVVAAGLLSPGANQTPLQLLIVNATSTSILDPWSVEASQ